MMKKLYCHENQFLVVNIKNLVEAQGIETFLKNEFMQGAAGELSAIDAWPELWVVNNNDYKKAMDIVEESQRSKGSVDWICNQCCERNDPAFEVCWQCQTDNT